MKVWLIGIKGAVATTTIVGTFAIKRGLSSERGIPTQDSSFSRLNLAKLEEFEFGGHDIRELTLYDAAYQNLSENGTFDTTQLAHLKRDIEAIPVRRGIANNCGPAISAMCTDNPAMCADNRLTLREATDQVSEDMRQFARGDECVVVNLGSTEPFFPPRGEYNTLEQFEAAIASNVKTIPASAIYAYCALNNEMPYVNFTPSMGNGIPALWQLAEQRGVPHCGKDGKTGETLVKTALAPMFKHRHLTVDGWYGSNILGNLDGQILNHDDNKESKLRTKTSVVPKMLGYEPYLGSRIDYFPPLCDHKVAWDFISFRGFLNHRMNMQFTWQGCDSVLAAPLVIDLIRFMALAKRKGIRGLVSELAPYFKDPLGTDRLDLFSQYSLFNEWVTRL
ncbi:MAG: inositol-3-phosphate synthase [Halobacteriota archaeon]